MIQISNFDHLQKKKNIIWQPFKLKFSNKNTNYYELSKLEKKIIKVENYHAMKSKNQIKNIDTREYSFFTVRTKV